MPASSRLFSALFSATRHRPARRHATRCLSAGRARRPAAAAALLCACSGAVSAAGLERLAGYPDFDLQLAGERIAVRFDDEARERELEHYSLRFSVAEPFGEHLRLRLFGGNSGASVDDRADLDGLEPTGYFLGIAAEWRQPLPGPSRDAGPEGAWRLLAEAALARHQTDTRRASGERVDLDWNRAELALGLDFNLGERWSVAVGSYALAVTGKRRSQVAGEATVDFENSDSAGLWGRLSLSAERTGRVLLDLRGGAQKSLSITFRRQY